MSDKNNSLEHYVADRLKKIDPTARKTRGSGCGNEIGDVSSKYFYIECKQQKTHDNVILDRKVWIKHLSRIPLGSTKLPFMCFENKRQERFVTLKAEDFFNIITEAYNSPEK